MYLLSRLFLFLTKSPDQLAKERADALPRRGNRSVRSGIPYAQAGP